MSYKLLIMVLCSARHSEPFILPSVLAELKSARRTSPAALAVARGRAPRSSEPGERSRGQAAPAALLSLAHVRLQHARAHVQAPQVALRWPPRRGPCRGLYAQYGLRHKRIPGKLASAAVAARCASCAQDMQGAAMGKCRAPRALRGASAARARARPTPCSALSRPAAEIGMVHAL